MTSSIGLWSAEEDGLSLLNLEPTGNVPESEFYYRLEDLNVPVRFRLVELIGEALDARYMEARGWIAVGGNTEDDGFKLDEFEGALFGEVVALRVRYKDLRGGCRLVLVLKEIGDDVAVYKVEFSLVLETLAQGRYVESVAMKGPVSAHFLHLERVTSKMCIGTPINRRCRC
jgi:hypothetical protein